MPDLLDRVLGYLDPDTEGHLSLTYPVLVAAMYELNRSKLNRAEIMSALGLTKADLDMLNFIYDSIFVRASYDVQDFINLLVLGATRNRSAGVAGPTYYDKATVKARLGL